MAIVALFVTATKLAGILVSVSVAANIFSFHRYRKKNLGPIDSPIDETSDILAVFNVNPPQGVDEFFFGLATAPAHVEDELDDAWLQFAENDPSDKEQIVQPAKTVWTTAGLSQRVNCSSYEEPGVVFERVFEQCTKAQSVEVAMICWSIWNRRNRWVWDRINGSVFGVRSAANHLHSEWVEAQAKTENRKIRGEIGERVWSLPAVGWFKVNVDAAVFMNGTIGVGAVIRDDRGCFVGARCLRLAGAWKPREAEALGLKEALSWITARGYTHCVIETDSYVLADACNGNPGRALFGTIVRDCVHLLKHINQVLVNFVYRSANNVAHVLAQATCSMSEVGEWYVTPPSFLMRVLELDLIV